MFAIICDKCGLNYGGRLMDAYGKGWRSVSLQPRTVKKQKYAVHLCDKCVASLEKALLPLAEKATS